MADNLTKRDPYNVSNPHPGFGTDKNIGNEFGHTLYPRYIEHEGKRVIVENAEAEAALVGGGKKEETKKPASWKS
jgi:hypothetical protein